MKVFITGASGRMGTHIIPHLITRGHTVTGLVRSPESAKKIEALGATAVMGTLSDKDLLVKEAKNSDGVIHCAMNHKTNDMMASYQEEKEILDLFADSLEGTNKPIIMSSATGFLDLGSDETSVASNELTPRAATETSFLGYKTRGIRPIAVRLAINTHSPDEIHLFEAMLIGTGRKTGSIPYIRDIRWSTCNAEDAGLLYVLALEKAEPGTAVHALQDTVEVKVIAEALAKRLGLKTKEVTKDQVNEMNLGWLGSLLQMDQDVSTIWTRKTFGWEPKGQRLLDELDSSDDAYFGIA
ncbi:Flavonol reductase/cinnamoyl-CoA reductase [Phaffia rhodozyma]|uniref:Flavonol reductase/cinnamoyl-CoA reductase n=1 Tax=Phaffia rhodozyma TaxID=264483 RepID=A0A0F7SXB4_PHARH|nr:Flavonol reductase/cinnamoyl-CoA reductase [Phaffia rhodozyma]